MSVNVDADDRRSRITVKLDSIDAHTNMNNETVFDDMVLIVMSLPLIGMISVLVVPLHVRRSSGVCDNHRFSGGAWATGIASSHAATTRPAVHISDQARCGF